MNTISFQSVYQTTTAQGTFKLGERAATADGREWQYVRSNATLATGNIVIPVAQTDEDLWSSSTDSQGRIVFLTRAASTMTVGAFEDGLGVVNQGTGVGQTFKIRTNSATTLTLYPETALTTALAVADSDLVFLSLSNVTIAAITSKLQRTQGATQVSAVSGDFGWILTNGAGRVMAANVLVLGAGFTSGAATTGQVLASVAGEAPLTAQLLGTAIVANDAGNQGALVRFVVR